MIDNHQPDVANLLRENERLRTMVASLQRQVPQKKYGLVWENEAEPEWHVPGDFFLDESFSKRIHTTDEQPENWLIEGENYQSLHALLATHRNQVDVIYIDPPYNTGNRDFHYKDHFSDAETAYKHSQWISFMHQRLRMAKELLSEKGAIFISIDDKELAQAKLLCDELFGEKNFVANFIRKCKSGSGHDSSKIAIEFDYMLCYAKDSTRQRFTKQLVDVTTDAKYRLTDAHEAHRGKYYLRDLDYKGSYSITLDYPIIAPDGSELWPGDRAGKPNTWRWSRDKVSWGVANDFIVFKRTAKKWKVYIKQYQFVDNRDRRRTRQIPYRALIEFSNSRGSNELKDILQQDFFTYPKPVDLIKFVINLMPGNALTVLDFFAGSGTTGHAVLHSNQQTGSQHRFILCTSNENQICEKVCYERLKRVVSGYETRSGKFVPGTGGNLRYWRVVERRSSQL